MRGTRLIQIVVLMIALIAVGPLVYADQSATLVEQLANDSSDKVRLAAAVNLAKLGDVRAVLSLAKALLNDSDANVRAVCAVGLGKLVSAATKPILRDLAVKNLRAAIQNDPSSSVQQQAIKALGAITGTGAQAPGNQAASSGSAASVYVQIGPMSSRAGTASDARLRALMVKVASSTLAKVAGNMSQTWPGGVPTKAALAHKSTAGFYIDGTLNTLNVKISGQTATITCKVSMLLADFPDKNMFGFLNGGASVQGSASAKDQELGTEDCVAAVIEDLVAKKIVPTICTKTSTSCP